MRLSKAQRIFADNISKFIQWCYAEGYEVTLGEAWRPNEMQAIYFQDGRSKKKYSKHQDKLAQDLNLFIDGKYVTDKELYRPLGEKWASMGGIWGGRYGVKKENYGKEVGWDSNHFEGRRHP